MAAPPVASLAVVAIRVVVLLDGREVRLPGQQRRRLQAERLVSLYDSIFSRNVGCMVVLRVSWCGIRRRLQAELLPAPKGALDSGTCGSPDFLRL
jgi:hypothetical protein